MLALQNGGEGCDVNITGLHAAAANADQVVREPVAPWGRW